MTGDERGISGRGELEQVGRQGLAAVPTGYLAGLVAIPAFAAFGFVDMMWHTFLGIEQTI
ncbi:hypothetical protein HII36_43495, partial [Nonomuraea sp. NN258]|nr:hypothetical protein [Nonomuraea antri]